MIPEKKNNIYIIMFFGSAVLVYTNVYEYINQIRWNFTFSQAAFGIKIV